MKFMYITNNVAIAKIAEAAGVDWIFIDLEIIGKEERQGHLDTVISRHTIDDVARIKQALTKSELLVRVNPINEGTKSEIERVIEDGADIIMLPYFKSAVEAELFIKLVDKKAKTCLLLETPEAVEDLDNILKIPNIDYILIGLNDLHLGYHLKFMFEVLGNGTVDRIIEKIKKTNIAYGFGGISRIGNGKLNAKMIAKEHVRLKSSMVILSRSFCDLRTHTNLDEISDIFHNSLKNLRDEFTNNELLSDMELEKNRVEIKAAINNIVKEMK